MQISLHKNARTTPATRREIRNSSLPIKVLARRLGLSPATVRKWKARPSVEDASHRPHTLHTTLTPDQEQVVVAVRTTLLLSLAELTGRQVPNLSRTLRMMEGYGLVELKKNVREIEPIAQATSFKILIG